MFAPGETVVHDFIIPFDDSQISSVLVTYKQNNRVILTKQITSNWEEVAPGKTKVTLTLTQKESLLFDDKYDYTAELNVMTSGGARATSKEIKGSTAKQHYKEVI